MYIALVEFKIVAGKRKEFLGEMRQVERVMIAEGCRQSYILASGKNNNVVVSLEFWDSKEAAGKFAKKHKADMDNRLQGKAKITEVKEYEAL